MTLDASQSQALAEILKGNKSLREVQLVYCQVGDVGAQAPGFPRSEAEGISQFALELAACRLWLTLCSTTPPSSTCTSLKMSLAMPVARPGRKDFGGKASVGPKSRCALASHWVTGNEANQGAPQGDKNICCRGSLEVDWDF